MKCVGKCVLAFMVLAKSTMTFSPVEKVVKLLQGLQARIENDGEAEQQIYNKYACWCEKTSARKAKSIENAQADLHSLGQSILRFKGKVAVLSAEIQELANDIAKNEEDQDQATALRSKENEAFSTESSELKQALAALQQAITVLDKASSASSLLQDTASATSVVNTAVQALPSHASMKPEQLKCLTDFLQSGSHFSPQSWTIQGVLKDMYDTFAVDLESSTSKEATANRNFEDYIATMTAELKNMKDSREKAEEEKANAEVQLADFTQTYDDTQAEMKANIAFFDATKAACVAKNEEWTTRSELRTAELNGIKKALQVLSSDDARALFASTIKPGKEVSADSSYKTGIEIENFLQVSSDFAADDSPYAHAYQKIRAQAAKTHSFRLAALAVRLHETKAGHFDKVIEAIDQMIATLKEEDAADIAKRDQCKDEYQKTNSTVANVTWLIKKNEVRIDKLQGEIDLRKEEKSQTVQDIQEVQKQIKSMKEERAQENQAFLNAKADDQKAITLLLQARDAMHTYYDKTVKLGPLQGNVKDAMLVQKEPFFNISADQAPEVTFSEKSKHKNEAKGIVQILTMIVEDLNDEIKNDMKAEEQTQLEFETQLQAAEKLSAQLVEKKINLEQMIAKRSEEKSEEENTMANNKADLKDAIDYKQKISPDCNWIIGAFFKRAERRAAEIGGLVEAKEFLVGNKQGTALVEQKKLMPSFDDQALSRIKFLGMRH